MQAFQRTMPYISQEVCESTTSLSVYKSGDTLHTTTADEAAYCLVNVLRRMQGVKTMRGVGYRRRDSPPWIIKSTKNLTMAPRTAPVSRA